MKRYDLINWFIEVFQYTRYLEIGIDNPTNCFDRVDCKVKVGVDPLKGQTEVGHHYRMTSDQFFTEHHFEYLHSACDIAFIDGLHIGDQMVRDVENVLRILSPNGTIICHDCTPYSANVSGAERVPGHSWYGTVWHGWTTLRATRTGLSMHVIPFDCGLGIVRRGKQDLYTGPYDTFQEWNNHRGDICQFINKDDLRRLYKP